MSGLSHLDPTGAARMVDVGDKPETRRLAVAQGRIHMNATARTAILDANLAKGDALAVARVAGIMAAKRTAELVPLCHPLPLTRVGLHLEPDDQGICVRAEVETVGRTGVEMEALTAVTVALLTLYDMAKALDRAMRIDDVHLVEKRGGRSGDFVAG